LVFLLSYFQVAPLVSYYPVLIFSLASRHSMWRAGRATRTLWNVYSEQMQM